MLALPVLVTPLMMSQVIVVVLLAGLVGLRWRGRVQVLSLMLQVLRLHHCPHGPAHAAAAWELHTLHANQGSESAQVMGLCS